MNKPPTPIQMQTAMTHKPSVKISNIAFIGEVRRGSNWVSVFFIQTLIIISLGAVVRGIPKGWSNHAIRYSSLPAAFVWNVVATLRFANHGTRYYQFISV